MKLLSIISLWALFKSCTGQSQVYLITAPKIFRVGASETVVAQTYGYEQDFAIAISLKSYPDRRTVYAKTVLTLNANNKFQASATLIILPNAFPINKEKPQYVYLEASSSDFTQEEMVLVSHQNGLLFIQTDKPVYTPDQSVKIRIYSLNEELKPAKRPVSVTFKDPEGATVDYVESEDITGIISIPDFKVPPNPKYGLWKMEAKYKSDFTTFTSTTFEIKEYVLPTFQISIKPEKNFISFDEFQSFRIDVMASYFHGEKVQKANVFLNFAILDKRGNKQLMPKAALTEMMENGHVTIDFNAEYATTSIEQGSLQDLHNNFLYIGVTVLDTSAKISEDAEYSDIIFTNSPYKINLVATPLFVKPNLPYIIRAQVKDMKGSPVGNFPVVFSATNVFDDRSEDREGDSVTRTTQINDGTIEFVLNIPKQIKELRFKIGVMSDEDNFKPREYTAKPYHSDTESYLYINWASNFQKFRTQDYLTVNLSPSSPYAKNIKHFHYQVVSKGKIVSYETRDCSPNVHIFNLNLRITAEMVPSARLIVYYLIIAEGRAEMVVDSVWFQVEEKCVNNQQLTVKSNSKQYKPASEMTLTINSRPNSLVALSSIDTAVYTIRTGSKISVEQVLLDAERLDLGCGAGGGKDNVDVFARAGLTFLTNANAKASLVTDLKCDAILRSKRDLGTKIKKKIAIYTSNSTRKCCIDGMKEYPVVQSCDERASRIKLTESCKDIFLECCKYTELLRAESQTVLTLARMALNNEFQLEAAHIRSFFPESWMWEVHEMSESTKTLVKTLPDSLTTWEIQGVGITETGICVADPIKVTVSESVILKAKIPYSVVRGEQIQLKVAVYNYNQKTIRTCVTMSTEEGTCLFKGSHTSVKGRQTSPCQTKIIKELSAIGFIFTVLPLEVGVHTVNFTLKTLLSSDVVYVRKLRVVPQGVVRDKYLLRHLDPSNIHGQMVRRVEIPLLTPLDIIPNTTPDRMLNIKGDIIGEALTIALDPEAVHKLTNLPSGSAESEVMIVAPIFFIYNYLQKTHAWNKLGPYNVIFQLNMKSKMKQGITSIMSFRTRNNYSYSMWKNGEASTWITAFILRIFGEVNQYIYVNKQSVCNTMNWLVDNCQNINGAFRELSSHVPLQVQRSLKNKDKETEMYLTAFTIIGLQKTSQLCGTVRVANAIFKANNYLSANLNEVESTLVLAVVAYALGLTDGASVVSNQALVKLKNKAFIKGLHQPPSHRYWKDSSEEEHSVTARSIEATSYALLAALCSTDTMYAKPIVRWLTEQQQYGGGFLSIQDTVTALEGLTKYSINMKQAKLDLSIKVAYKTFGVIKQLELTEQNTFSKPIEIEKNDHLILSTRGRTGRATLSLRTTYYTNGTSQETCDFSLTIDLSPVDSRMLQSDTEEVYLLKACARYNPRHREFEWNEVSGVMEIHLHTGFTPNVNDLETLLNGVDSLIHNYILVDQGVIIQVDEIPSDRLFCVGFHVYQNLKIGLVTPVPFIVYNDKQPTRKCTVFYKPPESKALLKLCSGDECKCMQAECGQVRPPLDTSLSVDEKQNTACGFGEHYAYKVRIVSSRKMINFIKYSAIILEIYMKVDDVEENSNITLVMMESCLNTLTQNKDYFIMGKESVRFRLKRSFMYEYPLDSSSWIEQWPSRGDCHEAACERFLQEMDVFSQNLLIFGCSDGK